MIRSCSDVFKRRAKRAIKYRKCYETSSARGEIATLAAHFGSKDTEQIAKLHLAERKAAAARD